jgi:hypothetical protein
MQGFRAPHARMSFELRKKTPWPLHRRRESMMKEKASAPARRVVYGIRKPTLNAPLLLLSHRRI